MITVVYYSMPSNYFKAEIQQADFDIKNHHSKAIRRVTGSEHYILRLLQAVRCGKLRTDELALYCGETLIDVDVNGEFIQPWPEEGVDSIFEADFYLRFHDYPQE